MSKISYEEKIELYKERKEGIALSTLSKKYNKRISGITYLVRLIDIHGLDIFKTSKNKHYSKSFKQEAIDRVLIKNEAVIVVALDIGLCGDGMLQNWIKKYKENGYNIVERKRGRSPTMIKKPKQRKNKETEKETITRLEKENEYLKAELEYSKKLRAVVQARKNQQQKKK